MDESDTNFEIDEFPPEIRELLIKHDQFRNNILATLAHFLRFDLASYEAIIIPNLPDAPTYNQVIRWPEVEHLTLHRGFSRVPGKKGVPFPGFHQASSDFFKENDKITLHLFHKFRINHPEALEFAFKIIKEALTGHKIDLAKETLDITRTDETPLSQDKQMELDGLARRVDTVFHFSPDYRSTKRYLNRKPIEKEIISFLEGSNHDKWIAELTAKGGTGKTMLIRWFISRHCIPKGIPCSRIDFDDVDLSVPVKPWQLLARFIRELEFQLPSTLTTLALNLQELEQQKNRGSEAEARAESLIAMAPQLIAEGLSHVGQKRLILILDTTEEALLSQRSDLHQFLASFIKLHELVPGLRILIAGRYPMEKFEQGPAFQSEIAPALVRLKLGFFSEKESRDYLNQRTKTISPDRCEAMIAKADGVPIKLAMLADLVASDPGMTAADIRQTERVNLVYLIKRIVARIPSPGVRWLLRYGTFTRSLTREFTIAVLSPFLEKGFQGRPEGDDPSADQNPLPKHIQEPDLYPALNTAEDEESDPEKLWDRLCDYASGSSWVEQKDDRLVFHSEVIDPMRHALAGQEIFTELHQAAADYFKKQIETDPQNHLSHRSNVLFHLMHIDSAKGRFFWRDQVASLINRDERAIFCTDLFSKDYLDPQGDIRTDLPRSPYFDALFLAEVYLEAAWASYDETSLENKDSEAMTFFRKGKALAGEHFSRFQDQRAKIFEAALAGEMKIVGKALASITPKQAGHESDLISTMTARMKLSPSNSQEIHELSRKIEALHQFKNSDGRSVASIQNTNRLAETLIQEGQVGIANQLLQRNQNSFNPIQIRTLIETGQYRNALNVLEPYLESEPLAPALKFECHFRRGEWLTCQELPRPDSPIGARFALVCGLADEADETLSTQFQSASGNPDEYFASLLAHHQLRYHFRPDAFPGRFEFSGDAAAQLEALIEVLFFQISERIVLENNAITDLGTTLNLPFRSEGFVEQFERYRDVFLTVEKTGSRIPLWLEFAFVVAPSDREALWTTLVADLEVVDHPVARAHLVHRLRDLPSAQTESPKILSLFPTSPDDPLLEKSDRIDFGNYLLSVAEVHRVFGDSSKALLHLKQGFKLIKGIEKPWLWREFQLAQDRLDPSRKPPYLNKVNAVADALGTFPTLALMTSLEQGERLVRQKNIARVLKMTTSIKSRLRGDQIPDLTRARFYSVLAAVSFQRGKAHDYEEAFKEAQLLCLGLGFQFESSEAAVAVEMPPTSKSPFAEPTLSIKIKGSENSFSIRHQYDGQEVDRMERAPRFFQPNDPFQILLGHLADPEQLPKTLAQTTAWLIGDPSQDGIQQSQFLRLEQLPPNLQPFPWELVQTDHVLANHQIYRSGTIYKYQSAHLRQKAALANHFGPDQFDLTDYRLKSKLPEIEKNLSSFDPISAIKSPPRIAMFEAEVQEQYGRQIGHAIRKVQLRDFALPDDPQSDRFEDLPQILTQVKQLPELIYLSFPFTATRATPRLALRQILARKVGSDADLMPGPAEFVEHFKSWSKHTRFPGIVIDVPYIDFPNEAAAQLAMRNQVAAELFRLAPFPFVLATGFWQPDSLHQKIEDLLSRFRERQSIGQIHHFLNSENDGRHDIRSLIDQKASVLFTHDPKLHTVPSP